MHESPCDIQTCWPDGQPGEQIAPGALARDVERGAAVLAGSCPRDGAAEPGRHELKAVADAEHGHARLEQPGAARRGGRRRRRTIGVDGRRAAGQDDRLRLARQHLLDRHGVRDDLGVHVALADPAGDQLGVLCAEIDDQDGVEVN